MKVIGIKQPGGFENLTIIEKPDPTPEAGQVVVKWHATSLNFHDYLVAVGGIPVPNHRVPMSDGAGEIIAIGEGVEEWEVDVFSKLVRGKTNFEKNDVYFRRNTRWLYGRAVGFASNSSHQNSNRI
jgi:NADPH:quinone reductase-like Zn-dependent oxidoreductase